MTDDATRSAGAEVRPTSSCEPASPPVRPDTEPNLDLIPARILNEWVYCPRLAYLEWVQGEWEDSADTVEGRHQHRRVDVAGPLWSDSEEEGGELPRLHARSILLSAADPGIIARMDLVEAEGRLATPVDYKHGRKPDLTEGAWPADLVQLGAQALVLRANGYQCERGVIYYIGSRERVEVEVTDALIKRVREVADAVRKTVALGKLPSPLEDSPKCPGCSLVGICLPDETRFLQSVVAKQARPDLVVVERAAEEVRRLYPILPDAIPVYVEEQGAYVTKQGECLVVKVHGEKVAEVPMLQMSHLAIFGNVQVTTQTIHELCMRDIPICYFSTGGWFYGFTRGFGSRNIELRRAQFRRADDEAFCLALARRIVGAKIRNQRTMLRRNGEAVPDQVLRRLDELADEATRATSCETLLGIEGTAARTYFENFPRMLRPRVPTDRFAFSFEGRNRRPPLDPVNAMLSLCYALLAKDCGVVLAAVGLDPFLGFYHTAHHGRQSLALDLMEEFRPILADSAVITAINNGEVRPDDFVRVARAVTLKSDARKRLIETYERRLDQVIAHPLFGYKVSYRKILEVQARLLGRYLLGEIPEFPAILPR